MRTIHKPSHYVRVLTVLVALSICLTASSPITGQAQAAAVAPVVSESPPAQTVEPPCPWMDTTRSPDERAQSLIISSTFDQKIRWLDEQAANDPTQTVFSGVTYTGVYSECTPIIQYTDGPAAISGGGTGITAFPAQIALAATWDTVLSRVKGKAHGYEAFHKHRNVLLGPGQRADAAARPQL